MQRVARRRIRFGLRQTELIGLSRIDDREIGQAVVEAVDGLAFAPRRIRLDEVRRRPDSILNGQAGLEIGARQVEKKAILIEAQLRRVGGVEATAVGERQGVDGVRVGAEMPQIDLLGSNELDRIGVDHPDHELLVGEQSTDRRWTLRRIVRAFREIAHPVAVPEGVPWNGQAAGIALLDRIGIEALRDGRAARRGDGRVLADLRLDLGLVDPDGNRGSSEAIDVARRRGAPGVLDQSVRNHTDIAGICRHVRAGIDGRGRGRVGDGDAEGQRHSPDIDRRLGVDVLRGPGDDFSDDVRDRLHEHVAGR